MSVVTASIAANMIMLLFWFLSFLPIFSKHSIVSVIAIIIAIASSLAAGVYVFKKTNNTMATTLKKL